MYERNEAVQKMISWLEEHLGEEQVLQKLSREIGYSPTYCSALFHQVCGCTIKSYMARRRLSSAARELQSTGIRILDAAVKYGFSSQEAFTRAFREAFGCTPAEYRKRKSPIPLFMAKEVFAPWQYSVLYKGGSEMSTGNLKEARVRVEYIPAHKYIGVWDTKAAGYGDFWQYHNCDQVTGIVESMRDQSHPVVTAHTAGWHYVNGERRYFYGLGVMEDYDGPVPEGFEIRAFPGSYYMVFYHPPFDYMEDNGEVMSRVEKLAWGYDLSAQRPDPSGISSSARGSGRFVWNEEECQCYQRHYPEGIGYEILRPVKLVK